MIKASHVLMKLKVWETRKYILSTVNRGKKKEGKNFEFFPCGYLKISQSKGSIVSSHIAKFSLLFTQPHDPAVPKVLFGDQDAQWSL